MTNQQLHDDLLERENVLAVWEDSDGVVHVVVSQKVPQSELDMDDIVENVVPSDRESDVHDAGFGETRDGFEPLVVDPADDADDVEIEAARRDRVRPVEAGVSEIHAESTAATAGPYPARVTDTSNGRWAASVAVGDLVRLSNMHVYGLSGQAEFGDLIMQPSPRDAGGTPEENVVGEYIGGVALQEGVTVDVAARSTAPHQDSEISHSLPAEWPTEIHREGYGDMVGDSVVKSGRTTGVTQADVIGTGASVRVNYRAAGVITLRDCILTRDFSEGGDSGSPVFHSDSGGLIGLLFAGSSRVTVVCTAGNVEQELGVEILTGTPDSDPAPGDHEPEVTFEDYVERTLSEWFGVGNVLRQHRLPSGRQVDLLAYDEQKGLHFACELENDAGSLLNGAGQARYYATETQAVINEPVVSALVFPEGHIDPDERPYLRQIVGWLWEVETPDDVDLSGV